MFQWLAVVNGRQLITPLIPFLPQHSQFMEVKLYNVIFCKIHRSSEKPLSLCTASNAFELLCRHSVHFFFFTLKWASNLTYNIHAMDNTVEALLNQIPIQSFTQF